MRTKKNITLLRHDFLMSCHRFAMVLYAYYCSYNKRHKYTLTSFQVFIIVKRKTVGFRKRHFMVNSLTSWNFHDITFAI